VRGSRGVAATRYGWCMHNRFADKPSNSLSRNILRISPLKSKILQEFLPKPLIPIDTKIKKFQPKVQCPFSENRELAFLIVAEIRPREYQTPDKPPHPTRTDPFLAVRLHAPPTAGRRDSATSSIHTTTAAGKRDRQWFPDSRVLLQESSVVKDVSSPTPRFHLTVSTLAI
jgi:hypothetical protein